MEAYRVSNGVKLERERSGWGTVVANSGPLSGLACEGVSNGHQKFVSRQMLILRIRGKFKLEAV